MPVGASGRASHHNANRKNIARHAVTMTIRIRWMSMSDIDIVLLFTVPALLLALVGWLVVTRLCRHLDAAKARIDHLEQQLELVRQSISGLTAGAVGMDRRVHRLEKREKALSERQESFEIQQADEQPYGQAIRLVQQGAGVGRLVSELDLSESEADLIVRLHGQRVSA